MLRYTAAFDAIGVTNSVTVTDADVLPDALEIARTESPTSTTHAAASATTRSCRG